MEKKHKRAMEVVFGTMSVSLFGCALWLVASILLPRLAISYNPASSGTSLQHHSSPPSTGGRVTTRDDGRASNVAKATASIGQTAATRPGLPTSISGRKRIPLSASNETVVLNDQSYPLRAYQALISPNDPQAGQWWSAPADLRNSWDISTGSTETTIAVIDTGIALQHEEFANRWHKNTGEQGAALSEGASLLNCTDRSLAISQSCNLVDDDLDGIVDNESGATAYQNPSLRNCSDQGKPLDKSCNRIDDDTNGYIDDVTGWDFINNDPSVQAGQLNPTGSGTTHATQVTGVAAATGNNGKGLAGIDWQAKLLPIQALDDDGYGDTVSVGLSIRYAIDQGADVINISLGTSFDDPYVLEAIESANAAGIVVVAASGNTNCDCIAYPARYHEVIAVGALQSNGAPASFSSWGNELDVLAPGTIMYSASWSAANQTASYASGINGTSFASPYVAGIISLMKTVDPAATPLQLIAALGEQSSKYGMGSSAFDTAHGFGTALAYPTLQRLRSAQSPLHSYEFSAVETGSYLTPLEPKEPIGSYRAITCSSGVASTPIYELSSITGSRFFSISRAEVRAAQSLGYSSALFSFACLAQAVDSPQNVRAINMLGEFRNLSQKVR